MDIFYLSMMNDIASPPKTFRRARTRTLIQLGGLIEKAGLLEDFGIKLGSDLQKDHIMRNPTAALFWGLLELKRLANSEEYHAELWARKGLEAYRKVRKS